MSQLEENKEFVRRFLDAMNRGDVQAIVDAYAADGYVWTMGNTLASGQYDKQQISEFAGGIYEAFPKGIRFEVLNMTAEDDRVAVEATSEGEHVSGAPYRNRYHFLFTLRDGKLASLKEYMDTELLTEVICGGQRPG